ncbi:hypothetical protein I6N90_14325 [Paenibacillus sp. GSMTC-2017]|uniref:hypothetical protein n=1 Tax=Paenibacillus sp. GSMTC-2017 TaxID=2794350 RepID=UPI0018D72861|nr:hypothetical protein [Paenibacillus sp. GSMTC-2017]MBH5318978.1 hypothetical protein [Paenibacillus sp. GSMTC-2017]
MIDFLKNKGIKAYNEIIEIAEQPNLLFSNDRGQYNSEASYNVYTIHKLNKLIKKNNISISELDNIFLYIEASWSSYLNKYFKGKSFVFYLWGDYQIPAIRVSVVSFYEGLELPFTCVLNKVNDLKELLGQYKKEAQFEGICINQIDESDSNINNIHEIEAEYTLTIYSKMINC